MEECDDTVTEASAQCMAATLQPGTSLVASGYCLYSSSTFFCLTLGAGVQAPLPRHALDICTLSRPVTPLLHAHLTPLTPSRPRSCRCLLSTLPLASSC